MNQGLILSLGTLPSSPIVETDGIPSHAPSCVKPVGRFIGFTVGFGGRPGNGLALRITMTWVFSASLYLSAAIFDARVESLTLLFLLGINFLTSFSPSYDSLIHTFLLEWYPYV